MRRKKVEEFPRSRYFDMIVNKYVEAFPTHTAFLHTQSYKAIIDCVGSALLSRVIDSSWPEIRELHRHRGLPTPQKRRAESLIPLGIPRYIRLYEDEVNIHVVFTGQYPKDKGYKYLVLHSSNIDDKYLAGYPDTPAYGHLGKKVDWDSISPEYRSIIIEHYIQLWSLV